MGSNKFSRALGHLKSTSIDEKIRLLDEQPTNNTSGIYTDEPSTLVTTTLNPELNELDLSQDDTSENGTDTSGLFMPDGTILTEEPPGDTSYILGPMAAMYYTWSYPWTMIGYIRQADRKFVNLGRIDGKLSDWDGSIGNAQSGTGTFISYGQLTPEQALWFRDVQKQPGATNDPSTYNYYAFYPGPPSQAPDEFGRYPCVITGVSKRRDVTTGQLPTPKSINDISTSFPFLNNKTFANIFSLLLGTDDSGIFNSLANSILNSPLGKAGDVFIGYLTGQLPNVIDNNFLGQDYVDMVFANMQVGYDRNGNLISVAGDNVLGSAQNPTYNPTTNQIEVNFNYDFDTNAEAIAKEPEKYNYKPGMNRLAMNIASILGGNYGLDSIPVPLAGWAVQIAKSVGGAKQTPGKITISPSDLQQKNPDLFNQLVNRGDFSADAATKPSQNKQASTEGIKLDPKSAIESIKQNAPPEVKMALEPSMDNFNKLSSSQKTSIMKDMKKQFMSNYSGSNYDMSGVSGSTKKYYQSRFSAMQKDAAKTKFENGYMITQLPNGVVQKSALFPTSNRTTAPKGTGDIALDTIPYEEPSPGPGGYKPPGSYDPNKFYDLKTDPSQLPSPNLPSTGPGRSSNPIDGTKVAASYPTTRTPLDKVGGFKGIPKGKGIYPMDKDGNLYNPQTGLPIKQATKKRKMQIAQHELQGNILSENRKKILREIKKETILPDEKKGKLTGYRPKTYGKLHAQYDTLMQKAENPASFKPMDETTWTKRDKYFNSRISQERKNEVLDHLGTGDHYWEIITETGRKRSEKGLKEKYGDYTLVRKEHLIGDTLLFLVDENGKKETILQSEYSDRIARQHEEPLWEQETLNAPNDPIIKRIRGKLATQIDYPNKPSPMGYPDGPTPQQVDGYHPEYGKRAAYYNALDPQSADAMPLTGDPETDAKVNAQKTPLKKKTKKELKAEARLIQSDWKSEIQIPENKLENKVPTFKKLLDVTKERGIISERMTTSGLGMINYPAEGEVDLSTATPFFTLSGPGNSGTYNVTTKIFGSQRSQYDTIVVRVTSSSSDWSLHPEGPGGEEEFSYLGSGGVGSKTVVIPLDRRYTGLFYAAKNDGSVTFRTTFQRRSPLNVFVPLDDPEANSFIRGGLGGDKERRKRLKDMLESGNKLMVMNGLEPSKTSPGDIELAGSLSGPRNYPGEGVPRDSPRGPYTPLKNYGTDKNPKFMPSGPSVNPWRLA